MVEDLLAMLRRQAENQVFAGGLALAALGTAAALGGRLLWSLAAALGERLLPSLLVDRTSPLFGYLDAWLRDHPYTGTCRNLAAIAPTGEGVDAPVWLVPGPGAHLLRHKRTWFWLSRSRDPSQSARPASDRERITLRALTVRRATLTRLVEDVVRTHGRDAGTIALYAATSYGEWGEQARIPCRPLASVVVADGIDGDLLADARRFLARRDWYAQRGVPWRRGYLFHGAPGTGKTSLIRALASELDIGLALLDLTLPNLDDGALRDLLGRIPANAALVLEDIDAVAPGRADTDRRLTLSGLLNALDGLGAPEGRLLFMTTNHPGRLDPALVRPGRIDRSVELAPLGPAEVERMVRGFFPDHSELAPTVSAALAGRRIPAAELQAVLLLHADEPSAIAGALVAVGER